MPGIFASTGVPGFLGIIHLDVIESITSNRAYDRTDTAVELGAPVTGHRQRIPLRLSVRVVISDVAPIGGAILLGLWETNHANRTRDAIYQLQKLGIPVPFFDGREIWKNPAGGWIVDTIDDGKSAGEEGIWRATINLGELPRFSTLFTPVPDNVDPGLADSVDGVVDMGTQSLEDVPTDVASEVSF